MAISEGECNVRAGRCYYCTSRWLSLGLYLHLMSWLFPLLISASSKEV
jgi:hypothetical protein